MALTIRTTIWIGIVALSLAGCRSKPPIAPPPPKPLPPVQTSLIVAPDANPDRDGRPSPIVIRLYQLREEGAFANAGYFALIDKEQEVLGNSLLSREEFELQPGATRELELQISPEARYLGVIAGYQNLNNSRWKALAPAPQSGLGDFIRNHKPTIGVGRSELTIVIPK